MNMITMDAIDIAKCVNDKVGMTIAYADGYDNVLIRIERDFFGNTIFFRDFLFSTDLIYSYINQRGFRASDNAPQFTTNSYGVKQSDFEGFEGFECFNPDGKHTHFCEYDSDNGLRNFDMEILENAIEGLKKALKVPEQQSKLIITDEVEFMDI